MAKRFFGERGPQLPPVDDDWQIQVGDDGVRISSISLIAGKRNAIGCAPVLLG